MKSAAYEFIGRLASYSIVCIALALPATSALRAQDTARKAPTIVWINSFYGPNNAGLGIAVRHGVIGIGGTVFGFAGDTTGSLPIRPGAIGISVDMYLAADLSNWFAIYGNLGLVGRLGTYNAPQQVIQNYLKHSVMSVGGGVQISVASHLVAGLGYNRMIDLPEHEGGATYRPIHSIVAQLGYRL